MFDNIGQLNVHRLPLYDKVLDPVDGMALKLLY